MTTRRQVLTEKYDGLKEYCKVHAPELLALFPEKMELTDLLFAVHHLFNDHFKRGDYFQPLQKALKLHEVEVDLAPHMPFLNEQIHFILTFMKTQK